VAGSFESVNPDRSHLDFKVILKRRMRKACMSLGANVDLRAGPGGEFFVSGDKVGVEVSLENVADLEALLFGRFEIKIDIALRIDDRSFALGPNHVGRMGQTGQVELFEIHIASRAEVEYFDWF
jgi:hypothetical protein